MTTPNKYPRAKPFDIIQTIRDLMKDVQTLKVNNPGQTGPWIPITTLLNGWTFNAGGYLYYRKTEDNQIQFSGLGLARGAGSATPVASGISLIPASTHHFPVACSLLSVPASPNNAGATFGIDTSGNLIYVQGVSTTAGTTVDIEATIPLDI